MLGSADRSDVKYMVFSSIAAFYQVDVSGHTYLCVCMYIVLLQYKLQFLDQFTTFVTF